MTMSLGITQFIFISLICYLEFKNKSSAIFLWATLLIMFGIMHMISSIAGDNEYDNLVLQYASIFAITFCILYLFTRLLLSQKNNHIYRMNIDMITNHRNIFDNILLCVLLFVVIIRTWAIIEYSGGILNTSWGEMRSSLKSLNYLNSRQLFTIIFFSLSGLPLLFALRKEKFLCCFCIFLILFEVIVTRDRIEILPIICSFIALFLVRIKRINLRTILFSVVIAFITVCVIYSFRVFRHYGSIYTFISNFNLITFTSKIFDYIITGNGELGLRRVFYYFLAHNNEFPGFGEGASYIRMLLVFVPTRWSLGLKPDDFAIKMGMAIGMGPGGSTHPTLFGDCYANLGIYGVLLGIFWGVYVTLIDNITRNRKTATGYILIFMLNSVSYCIIGRGSVYNAFFINAWGMLLIILFDVLFVNKKVVYKSSR